MYFALTHSHFKLIEHLHCNFKLILSWHKQIEAREASIGRAGSSFSYLSQQAWRLQAWAAPLEAAWQVMLLYLAALQPWTAA